MLEEEGDRKRESFAGLGGQIPLFLLELLLPWVKLERTTILNGFGLEESTLGRAKEKQSGFTAIGGREQPLIPSFISCHKLQSALPGRCVCVCLHTWISHYRRNKLHLYIFVVYVSSNSYN